MNSSLVCRCAMSLCKPALASIATRLFGSKCQIYKLNSTAWPPSSSVPTLLHLAGIELLLLCQLDPENAGGCSSFGSFWLKSSGTLELRSSFEKTNPSDIGIMIKARPRMTAGRTEEMFIIYDLCRQSRGIGV